MSSCVPKARAALLKMDGVKDVTVDFYAKTAAVVMKGSNTLRKEDAEAALKGVGYWVTSFEQKRA